MRVLVCDHCQRSVTDHEPLTGLYPVGDGTYETELRIVRDTERIAEDVARAESHRVIDVTLSDAVVKETAEALDDDAKI